SSTLACVFRYSSASAGVFEHRACPMTRRGAAGGAGHTSCPLHHPPRNRMTRRSGMADDAAGKATHLGGKIKEGVGDLLGDREMEREGKLDQMEGQAEQDQARAEEEATE